MSLGVAIKGPEGIVLATDSRVTLEAQKKDGPNLPVYFDNVTKLASFTKPHNYVGCITYGMAVIGSRTAHSYIPEFEQQKLSDKKRCGIEEYSNDLCSFYKTIWKDTMPKDYTGPDMNFLVGGYDPKEPYGRVFLFNIPSNPKPVQQHSNDFGMSWGGQLEIASRLIHGFDPALPKIVKEFLKLDDKQVKPLYDNLKGNLIYPIPYTVLPLQDCVDLAILLIRTTILAQRLAIGIRGVGGPIDVAIITRTKPLQYVQQKEIHGEIE